METRTSLLTTQDPLPDHLPPDVARQIIELARSQDPQDIDALIEVGLTRGPRHPRLAVEAMGCTSRSSSHECRLHSQNRR
jgi:hypothetical protein